MSIDKLRDKAALAAVFINERPPSGERKSLFTDKEKKFFLECLNEWKYDKPETDPAAE